MEELVTYPEVMPQGLIKVELFEEGKKIQEIEDHNFIAPGLINHVFKARIKDLFTQKRATDGGLVSDAFNDFFKQISLTDASHPEDPANEWIRRGNLIGYAYSDGTYAGGDTQRGTYNAKESITTKERVRMVFDFPTHAANGEIKSIYFHPDNNIYNTNNFFNKVVLSNARSIKKYNNKYYVLKSSLLEVYDLNWVLLESHALGDNAIQDFEIVDDVIYYAANATSVAVRKANLSSPKSFTTVINNLAYTAGIAYITDEEKFVVVNSSGIGNGTSSVYTLNYYDKAFNLIESFNAGIGYGPSNGSIFYQNGILFLNTFSVDKNKDINYVTRSAASVDLKIIGIDSDKLYVPYGSSIYEVPKLSIGSRSLLVSPITKTNKHTMKITYDFILE